MSGYITRDAWSDERGDSLLIGRRHDRGHLAAGAAPGGQPTLRTRKTVPCPTCGAKPGQSCVRRSGGKVRGRDVGGGYDKPMRGYHDERRLRRQPAAAGEETS